MADIGELMVLESKCLVQVHVDVAEDDFLNFLAWNQVFPCQHVVKNTTKTKDVTLLCE